jgi:uncharacterized protein (DUF4415 family)
VIEIRPLSRRRHPLREPVRRNTSRPNAENPEWTADEIWSARPVMGALPKETAAAVRRYRGQRGLQKSPTKKLISLRVDRDDVAAYRATGAGWQTRANDALRAYAKRTGLPGRLRRPASLRRRLTGGSKHP